MIVYDGFVIEGIVGRVRFICYFRGLDVRARLFGTWAIFETCRRIGRNHGGFGRRYDLRTDNASAALGRH